MSRQESIERLMRGVGLDVRDYRHLCSLLEDQFQAAIRHDATAMEDLTERISNLVDGLERRRLERVGIVHGLLGPAGRVSTLIEAMTGARQKMLATGWETLESLVLKCKDLNTRNCQLMTEQNSLMQRVLHGDTQIYAPL